MDFFVVQKSAILFFGCMKKIRQQIHKENENLSFLLLYYILLLVSFSLKTFLRKVWLSPFRKVVYADLEAHSFQNPTKLLVGDFQVFDKNTADPFWQMFEFWYFPNHEDVLIFFQNKIAD